MTQFAIDARSTNASHRDDANSHRIGHRLKLYFALLSCMGGLVLTSDAKVESVTVMAVFFSVFGYVFVDWLELFALPAIAAYVAMGMAALYCLGNFIDLDAPDNHQMLAVAQLLVFVQAILMLQRKSRRILEQLGVFCLLELIVAAVFNNAIYFGILLVPISVVGTWALSSLAALSAADGIITDAGLDDDDKQAGLRRSIHRETSILTMSPESGQSLSSVASRLPRIAMLTFTPAVALVATIFFYVLPRTTDAARGTNRNNAIVGFSDVLRLEQIGQMMQSSETAMRVRLIEHATGKPYVVDNGIYLRGRVLERYTPRLSSTKNSAEWSTVNDGMLRPSDLLPAEFIPPRRTDENFYDAVDVQITCESSRSGALFAIAPYYRVKNQADVVHRLDRWTIGRRGADDAWIAYPRTAYDFGTHAFRQGIQTDLIARWPSKQPNQLRPATEMNEESADRGDEIRRMAEEEGRIESYIRELLVFDIESMPATADLAARLASSADVSDPDESDKARSESAARIDSQYRLAKAMEAHLASSGKFTYSLNLNAESYPGMDPIEQFLLIDRRGHCQYFASALAMMLRSQKIPARIVVGYQTDEYNEIGGHYVARQLHAHAWVEALIHSDELDGSRAVYGQPESDAYWVRLDPTPGEVRVRAESGGVGKVLDLAQNMWDDYVVEMDGSRQESSLLGQPGINPMHRSYARFVDQLGLMISRIRAGELGGGSLAGRNLFSWPAAVLGVGLAMLAILIFRLTTPKWLKRSRDGELGAVVAQPKIQFYADALALLSRAGVFRGASQTPSELASEATHRMQHPMVPSVAGPLDILTRSFYRYRFGHPAAAQKLVDSPIEPASTINASRAGLDFHRSIEHPSSESGELRIALAELSRSVDLLTIGRKAAERKQ